MNEMAEKLEKLAPQDKRLKILLIGGILGILLIFLSGLDFSGGEEALPERGQPVSNQEYILSMETKLEQVLEKVQGVGKVQVMLTVDQGPEYVYASEEKTNSDRCQDYEGNLPKKVQTKTSAENSFILVDDARGNAQPLIRTQIEPVIKGVVVVCGGADSALVCGRITDALTTALGIGANQVCIVPAGE